VSEAHKRTIEDLGKVISTMQFLQEHPRMQQRNWVASSRDWLPVLHRVQEDLIAPLESHELLNEALAGVFGALERVGLIIEKRDAATWGYRWDGGALIGVYPSRAQAIESALRDRLDVKG